jgi:hypothetical protein
MTLESPRILQLRQELADLETPESGLADMAAATRASIMAELRDLGAEVEPHDPPRPPVHAPIRLTSPRPRPVPTPAVQAPAPPEAEVTPAVLMGSAAAHLDPQARLQELLALHAQHAAADNGGAAGLTRLRIRKHCARYELPVPELAKKRPMTTPYEARRKPAPKNLLEWQSGLIAKMRLGEPPSAAARLRALRGQALQLLPLLKELNPSEAEAALAEQAALIKVLGRGVRLIIRRIA